MPRTFQHLRKRFSIPFLTVLIISFLFGCKDDLVENPISTDEGPDFALSISNSELPYIIIDTEGETIQNEPKIPAVLRMYLEKVQIKSSTIGIEYRGSTSFRLSDKKSFGLETWDIRGEDSTVSFFDFPEEEDWILNGHIVNLENGTIVDKTLMYHYFGYELFRNMGRYASRCKFVELQINDEYQGVYVFMEKLKRDGDRIDVKKLKPGDTDSLSITGGYILKIDKTAGSDLKLDEPLEYFEDNWEDDARYQADFSFRSHYDINGEVLPFEPYGAPYHASQYLETYFIYEYPDADDITEIQKEYIQDYIYHFETALLTDDFNSDSRTYPDYIDINSFVDFFIINEICRNVDGYRLSTYMYKDRGEKLKMGPIWDLNIGYDTGDRIPWDDWVINYNKYVNQDPWMMPFWWPRLMQDPQFRTALKNRWNELRLNQLSENALLTMVDETAHYLKENGAIERNFKRWNLTPAVDYDEAIESFKGFLIARSQWMDETISAF